MPRIKTVERLQQLRLVANPHRLKILQLLSAGPASCTRLGRKLRRTPAWVLYHLKQLQAAGLVEPAGTTRTSGVVEKFYRLSRTGMKLLAQFPPRGKRKLPAASPSLPHRAEVQEPELQQE